MGCCASNDAVAGSHPNKGSDFLGNEPNTPQRVKPLKTPDHPLYQGELGQASLLFFQERYSEAAAIFREYLEKKCQKSVDDIDGLGQTEMSLGYYEWYLFRWYKEGIEKKEYIGTAYDALSLCYQALKNEQNQMAQGQDWYMMMVDDYPQNHGLMMGYANILNNRGFYEEAIDYYSRVLDLRPDWLRPLECIAYIYEYKRIDKKKACETANKILHFEPNNRVALFILARNIQSADEKIEKLKIVKQKHPKYARCVNQIGIVYGGTKKQYREAITWYQKASEICPEYSSCYNNIGVNFELLKDHDEAITWYFRGIEKDKEYKAPHKNLSDIFDELKYTDQQIQGHMSKYKILNDYFYYYMALSYHDKKKYDLAIKYFMKAYDCAKQLNKNIFKIHNSIGITYDDMRRNEDALKYYTKCIGANPKYHSAYYNMAIVYKRENKISDAINWYQKAIEANPRYSYAYNNLGNIYKNQNKFEEAIKCYKNAVKYLSTYTLALANLGVCYLKIQNFRQAFNAMERAKECLPTDNNNLSQGNKDFLKETLGKFDKEGESWRQNGCITKEQRDKLKNLIKNFQSNFGKTGDGKVPVSRDKILKPQILQIIRLIHKDKFGMQSIDRIYAMVKIIFEDNEEYFHIIPQLFIEYFLKNVFDKKRPVLQIEKELFEITKKLSAQTVAGMKQDKAADHKGRHVTFNLKHFEPPNQNKVNLFKLDYFNSYEDVYSEIISVNEAAGNSYNQFKSLVDSVKRSSYGQIYGVGMKIPKDEQQQYKVILRIFQKMFKKELTPERVQSIIEKIDVALHKKQDEDPKQMSVSQVVGCVMGTWTKEITEMVVERKKQKIPTKCQVSDLLRGKVMFDSVDHLRKAIASIDALCNIKSYQIIEMDNRLAKQQTQDVVFKLKIKEAVCELQLAMKQDETQYHFTHSIYEIERSPLGCIFGSYIFMSKGFQYPLKQNCKDIVKELKQPVNAEEKAALEAAQYVVANLMDDADVNTG